MAGPVIEIQRGVPFPEGKPGRGVNSGLTAALRRLRSKDESVWVPREVCSRRGVADTIHGLRRTMRKNGQPLASFVQRASPEGTRIWRRA